MYLHGGPGGADCTAGTRRYFDPDVFRAVLFDQRGCGRSTPQADDPSTDLSTNTTDHLITDIERLREHLGIDKWVVAGGVSWGGVCLALAYAQAHPDRVAGMALGAITAGSRREVEWITRDMRRIFPREWERFVEPVPPAERDTNLAAATRACSPIPTRPFGRMRRCAGVNGRIPTSRSFPDGRPHPPAIRIRRSG